MEPEEVESEETHIFSLGLSFGPGFYLGDTVDFTNELFINPVVEQDANEDEPSFIIEFSSRYGLDHYILPGISLGLKLRYSSIEIDDVQLNAFEEGIQVFAFDDELLKVDTFSTVPFLELRLFTFLEYLLEVDFSPSMEIFFQVGIALHYNSYDELSDDIQLDNFEDFTWGLDIAGGIEFFLSANWSLRWEFGVSYNSSEFDVVENVGNQEILVFTADLDIQQARSLLSVQYYF